MLGLLVAAALLAPEVDSQGTPAQALAPTGRLRVALLTTNPVLVSRDSGPVEIHGLAPDLGRILADWLRVSFQPLRYTTAPQLLAAATADVWDVSFLTVDPERSKVVDFTPPYLQVENGLLAAPHSRLTSARDVDAPGVRIAVVDGSSNSLALARSLRSASLVRTPSYDMVPALLRTGQVDAFADNLQLGLRMAERVPGARVLDNGLNAGRYAMAVPKGNRIGLRYLSDFIDREKRSGHLAYMIARAQLRGVAIVPSP
jgi:polar amino acid transport system substrate-binding protein